MDRRNRSDAVVLGLLSLLGVAIHLPVLEAYGWFRDELYYAVCAERLAFGYVDHPPAVALVARGALELFGPSLTALRLVSVLAGGAVAFLAGWLARELGGGRWAQVLAALCVLAAPVYLFAFHVYSMNSLEVLLWALGALVLARLARTGDPRLWALFGLVAGAGLQTKHSFLFFGFGVAMALFFAPERRHLRTPWPWLGAGVALALFLPNLIWQAAHGWPTLEFLDNAQAFKNVSLGPLEFLGQQVLLMNPLAAPVWASGLLWLLFARRAGGFRLLGFAAAAVFGLQTALGSKPYYLSPLYPLLFAAGGTAIEAGLARLPRPAWRNGLAGGLALLLVASGAALAPLSLPVLSPESFSRYSRALGLTPTSGERHATAALPQHFADMHGWDALVAEVARVWTSLPAEERRRTGVFVQNYGEAGAIDVLGRNEGLPRASSGHNNYFLWGPQAPADEPVELLVILGGREDDHRAACADLRRAGEVRCGLCMPYEDRQPVYLCRRLRTPAAELWPRVKHFN